MSTTSTQPAVEAADLQNLVDDLMAPREIVREADGQLIHPALPNCDEGVNVATLLAAFGLQTAFVSMETDCSEEVYEAACEACNFSAWTPTTPFGDGWRLLEIYDTEDGPYAFFARKVPYGTKLVINLTAAEIQSNSSRVDWAEGLISQLPADHDGRNSWLRNYSNPNRSRRPRSVEMVALPVLDTPPKAAA